MKSSFQYPGREAKGKVLKRLRNYEDDWKRRFYEDLMD